MKRFFFSTLMLLSAIMLFSGCLSVTAPHEQTDKLRLQILVDGADTIYIQGDRLWLRHHAYELPGRWRGAELPMTINGQEWYPSWDGDDSSIFKGIDPPLPDAPVEVALESYSSVLGSVAIWQQPSQDNQYTLVIAVDDRGPDGAHWYTIDLDW